MSKCLFVINNFFRLTTKRQSAPLLALRGDEFVKIATPLFYFSLQTPNFLDGLGYERTCDQTGKLIGSDVDCGSLQCLWLPFWTQFPRTNENFDCWPRHYCITQCHADLCRTSTTSNRNSAACHMDKVQYQR